MKLFKIFFIAVTLFVCNGIINNVIGQSSITTRINKNNYIITLPASNITESSAQLMGTFVENKNSDASYTFWISDSTDIPMALETTCTGNDIYATANYLKPNTTYHFWIERRIGKESIICDCHYFTTKKATFPIQPIKETKLPTPPKITAKYTKHRTSLWGIIGGALSLDNLTGTKKKIVNACNYRNETVRTTAVRVAGQDAGSFNVGQICDIFDYCFNQWHYVNDPQKRDYYEYASRTIKNGLRGDCDDFAILTCSMLLAIGADARLTFAYGKDGGHAYTEVNLGKKNITECTDYIKARYAEKCDGSIKMKTDKEGNYWLNMDWWANHPGGKYYSASYGTIFYILDNYCIDFHN